MAPGQGIEDWASGLDLLDRSPETARIYEEIYDVTQVDIIDLCRSDNPSTDPGVVQPAALGIGVAQANILAEEGVRPDYLIGLSAGEFTVAAISGALRLKEAAYISQQRGVYQAEAANGTGSAVTAIHKRPLDIKTLLKDLPGAWPANFLAADLTTFSYLHGSYDTLVERLIVQGARVRDLNMPFPPHGISVKEAQDRLAILLSKRGTVKDASTQIISIRTAQASKKARTIRHNLIWQTTEPTQLNRAVNKALEMGVEEFYDIGPDNSITKILGRIINNNNIVIKSLA